jgi:spermidine synthase
VLAAHLLAIALGSLLLGPRARSRDRSPWVLLLAALPVALLPAGIEPVAHWASARALEGGGAAGPLLLTRTLAAGLLLVPSTLLCAAALPWLLQRLRPEGGLAPQAAGRLLAWNTGGAAFFALGTGAFWLPAVGSRAVLLGAAGLLVLAAALLSAGRVLRGGLVLVALALLTQPWLLPFEDAAGRDAVGASFLPAQFAIDDAPALFFAEGSATTVVVREREGHRELWVEGKIEASTQPTDRLHLTLLGALPMALHPDPQRVALIGLGTGRTAQAVAAFGPRRLLLLEIEPEVLRTVGRFAADGGGLPAGAEVRIGDARHSLTRSAERFDVITSDPVHPGVAGSAALYATEMYALALERLAPGGLFCQWLPLYQLTGDDVRLALRTFADAFPHAWAFLAGEDLILVGGGGAIQVEEARLRERLAGEAGSPLRPLGLASPGRLLALVLKGPEGLRRFTGEGPRNSDDRLLLEFRAGRSWFVDDAFGNLTRLWPGRAKAADLLAAPPSPAFELEVARAAPYWEGVRAGMGGEPARAAEAFGALAALDPADRFAAEMRDTARLRAAASRAERGLLDEALVTARAMAQEPGLTPGQRLDVAALLREWGAPEEGRLLRRGAPHARWAARAPALRPVVSNA